ncbi:hypothetical protein [Streptomyces sp. NPDC004629]|uniref:hypothetical protein n=1 Tax=Streptomyces sp. NPDC004629 TaxID=3364705 RepID=UPI0036A69E2D
MDSDLSAVAKVLAERWTLTTRGLNVKAFPACYAVHPAGEAAVEIHASGVHPDTIVDVAVTVQPSGLTGPIHHHPETADQARFSMEYTVAAALVDGHLGVESFNDDRVSRAPVRRLMSVVRTFESAAPPYGPAAYDRWYATVENRARAGPRGLR